MWCHLSTHTGYMICVDWLKIEVGNGICVLIYSREDLQMWRVSNSAFSKWHFEDTYAHPNSENPFKCDIHVCFMLFPKYSLENSSDPIMCSYTGKKLFKSNRLQFSQNLCLNKHTVCAFILGRNTTCEWLWKYKGYCVHSFWVKTINIWSRYVNYNYCRAHWPMQNKLYHLKLLFVVKADTDT